MRTADFTYDLPSELIAAEPLPERSASRMLVLDRKSGSMTHRTVADLPEYFEPQDLAVLNDTRVIPARLYTESPRVEILLLEEIAPRTWVCMARPGRKLRPGLRLQVADTWIEVLEVLENGERIVRFDSVPDLDAHGAVPLPPYIQRQPTDADLERYQTVYACNPGAVAAPTAGLHLTMELLAKIPHTAVTLHVGAGTFQPVKCDLVKDHIMHEERYVLTQQTAAAINAASKVTAIGTTCVRVLETCAGGGERVQAGAGRTDIFIYPPYTWRVVDRLLTNFHLPESTLLMLVSAFAGRELVLEAYAEAVRQRYRFFSYGDCMLIL